MARKRRFSTFSLSFLDIMSCGFGAVALIFLIIKHDIDTKIEVENEYLLAEVMLLEEEVLEGEEGLVLARNTLSTVDDRLAEAQGLARRIVEDINAVQGKIIEVGESAEDTSLNKLKEDLEKLEEEKRRLIVERDQLGESALGYKGDGDRQYLTGLKLGGARILILLDASASMLDDKIVNVIRRRNMSDNVKRASKKWQRALRTVEWLSAQFSEESRYQIYTFNTSVQAVVPNTEGTWLQISEEDDIQNAVSAMRKTVPQGGTSLERAFRSIQDFPTLPDNIILITDGLPTQSLSHPKGNTVTGAQRSRFFSQAIQEIPRGIPVNIILAPMEGDPLAAASFWQLAAATQGSFMSPSKDWP